MDRARFIVVTGGAGFIGSSIVKQLNDLGYEKIVIVDHLGCSDKWKNLVGKKFSLLIEKGRCFEWLRGKEDEIGAIFHLGACSNTLEVDASYLLENNYQFSIALAEYAFKHGLRLIYASSAATYGSGEQGFEDNHDGLQQLRPLNMYGYSKHLFDLWLESHGLLESAVGLKYFNVFGPNESHKGRMASAIVHFLPLIQKEGKVRLFKSSSSAFGDGEQLRDFIYVKDAARMSCAFLERGAGIYNIGTGVASSWNSLARALFLALGLPEQIDYVEMPVDLIGKYQNYTCASMDKTRALLGDQALCMSLEDSVCDYVIHYLLPGLFY